MGLVLALGVLGLLELCIHVWDSLLLGVCMMGLVWDALGMRLSGNLSNIIGRVGLLLYV